MRYNLIDHYEKNQASNPCGIQYTIIASKNKKIKKGEMATSALGVNGKLLISELRDKRKASAI